MGNSKNKKVLKKRRASNKSNCRTSSDQKENVPKNEKTRRIKPGLNDGIAMSKQLLLKKSNVRTQRRSSSKPERICANGKPLPSLAELEKMYEDSDDDQPLKTPTQMPTCTTSTPEKQIPKSISKNNLLSPSTINKITERIMGSIQKQNLPDPSELMEATSLLRAKTPPPPPIVPPKKRKKPDLPYIVGCKDRPKVIRKPNTNFCKGFDDYGVEASSEDPEDTPTKRAKKSRIPNYSKSIFNAHSDEIAERLTKDDAGGLSDASTDSNKTIEYNPTLFQNSRPHSFSPLPSTSTDSETFRKNDELFNESLKEINISRESTPKLTEDDLPMIKLSPSTNKEADFLITKEPTTKKKGDLLITNLLTPNKRDDLLITKQSTPENKEDDVQIIDTAYDTIVIEDVFERTVGKQHTSNTINTNIIEIIDPEESEVVKTKEETIIHKISDDEECMIVPSSETIKNHNNFKLNEPIVIDDEYSTINTEFDSFNNEPIDIIDVDDIIAETRSILDKWKNFGAKELNKINTVVDVPTTYKNMAPQTTVTPSTTAQTTVTPRTTVQTPSTPGSTLQASVTPNITHQIISTPGSTLQASVTPNITHQIISTPGSTLQASVTPNITHQIISTPGSTLQASVTPNITHQIISTPGLTPRASVTNSTIPSTSTPNPNNYLNLTNRNIATNSRYNQRQPTSASYTQRAITLKHILNDFFRSQPGESQNGAIALEIEIAALYSETDNRRPRPTSNSIGTPSHSVNNAVPVLTNATPVSINAAPVSTNATPVPTNANPVSINAGNRRRFDVVDISNSPPPVAQQTSMATPPPSPVPSRNIGDCPICLDPLQSSNGIASTICGHVFCLKCIQASVKINGKKCPTCRKTLKGAGGGYHQLYL